MALLAAVVLQKSSSWCLVFAGLDGSVNAAAQMGAAERLMLRGNNSDDDMKHEAKGQARSADSSDDVAGQT